MPRYRTTAAGETKAFPKTFTKARRIGGTYAASVDAANLAAGYIWNGAKWINAVPIDVHVTSASFNQAKNVLAEIAAFVESASQHDKRFKAKCNAESIEFATGASIVAHPAKPASLRTWTGALLVDEFAFIQNPEDFWAAAKNIAGQTLREPRGYPVSLVTTPWAYGSFPHRVFTDEAMGFQRHRVDIYDAKRDGFPIDIEQTRAECALAEIFATEFECQWIKGGACFFDPDLLVGAEREDLPDSLKNEPSFWGIDIGRTNDLTVLVECKRLGDVIWIVGITALRAMHFDDQRDAVVSALLGGKIGRCLIDRGGMGRDLADHLERKFSSRAKGVDFSADSKEEMAVAFKAALESGRIRVWTGGAGDHYDQARSLRVELTSIKTKTTPGGRIGFVTPRSVTGHGDRAWAAMLAFQAVGATTVNGGGNGPRGFIVSGSIDTIGMG